MDMPINWQKKQTWDMTHRVKNVAKGYVELYPLGLVAGNRSVRPIRGSVRLRSPIRRTKLGSVSEWETAKWVGIGLSARNPLQYQITGVWKLLGGQK